MRFISSSYIILALDGFGYIHGKGLAVIGGKGNREVCPDCPDNYNAEELTWALVTLAIVTGLFLSICFCRFYPKIRQLFTSNGEGVTKSCQCTGTLQRGSINTPTSLISPITMMNSTGQGSLASPSTAATMVSTSTSKSSSLTKQSSTEINNNICLTNNANNKTSLNSFNHSINDNFNNSTNANKLSNTCNNSLMSNPKGSRISVSYSTPMDPLAFNSEPTTSLRSTSASHASASTNVPSSASSHTSLSSSNHLQYHHQQQHHNLHHSHQQQQHNHSHRSSLKSTSAPVNSSTCQLMCPQVVSITTTTSPPIINDQSTVYTSHI